MDDPDDTGEYEHIRPLAAHDVRVDDAHDRAAHPADDPLDHFSSLDAPRWVVLLAAIGLAWTAGVLAREASRLIAGALGH